MKISKSGEEPKATEKADAKPKEEKLAKKYPDLKLLAAIGGVFMASMISGLFFRFLFGILR